MKPLVTIASTLMFCACVSPLGAFPMADEPPKPPAAAAPSPPSTALVLQNAGDEPKTKLRYTFTVGETARFELVQNALKADTIDGQPAPKPSPVKTTTRFATKVLSVDEWGTATIEVKIDSMRTESAAMSAKEQAEVDKLWSVFKNATGVMTVDPRGADVKLEMKIPPALDKQLVRQAGQLNGLIPMAIVCLPEEPVGKNATWKAGSASAIEKGQGREFKLTDVSSKGAKIEHQNSMELKETPLPADKVPEGVRGFLEKMTVESSERRTLAFPGSPLSPGSFGTKSNNQYRFENADGEVQRSSTKVDAEFVLRRITG